jgi:hypothetical protein
MRPIVDTLREVEFGNLLEELTAVQAEVVQAVSATQKGGEITIKLTYKPEGNGQLTIKADVKKKVPQHSRGTSLFFMTPEGSLQREDPRQQKLPLKSVDTEDKGPLRTVGAAPSAAAS